MKKRKEANRRPRRPSALLVFCCILFDLTGRVHADIPSATGPLEQNKGMGLPIVDYQKDLLDVSFRVASKIPTHPHIKDRSRAQEAVVLACLELGLSERAISYIEQIENWRKGSCYADLAFFLVKKGEVDSALGKLELAEKISKETEDWRKDRILTKIAKTKAWLGDMEEARALEKGRRTE